MYEILGKLKPGSCVLDLGCHDGSFHAKATQANVYRLDLDPAKSKDLGGNFIRGDATLLPFPDQSFDAVIANHSLEHFENLDLCLSEIRRILKDKSAVFISVPDASTFTDKIYRWLARGGGHVNAFTSRETLARKLSQSTGKSLVAIRPLCSSLSFLNRKNSPSPRPRKLILLGGGYEWSLSLYIRISRKLDRMFSTRFSDYGWAFYLGEIKEKINMDTEVNVCIRCGSSISQFGYQSSKKRNIQD